MTIDGRIVNEHNAPDVTLEELLASLAACETTLERIAIVSVAIARNLTGSLITCTRCDVTRALVDFVYGHVVPTERYAAARRRSALRHDPSHEDGAVTALHSPRDFRHATAIEATRLARARGVATPRRRPRPLGRPHL